MSSFLRASIVVAAAIATLTPGVATAGDPDAYEQRLLDELAAKNKAAAEAFRKGNDARDRDELEIATAHYREVHRLVPSFVHATRRRCSVERQLGRRELAVALCREAVEREESAPNLAALALALSTPPRDEGDANKAIRAAERAMEDADEEDVRYANDSACKVGINLRLRELLDRCSKALAKMAPKRATTHLYLAHFALLDGRAGDAQDALDRAIALGLSKEAASELAAKIAVERPPAGPGTIAARVLAGWIAGLVALLLVGLALSRLTLAAATPARSAASAPASRGARGKPIPAPTPPASLRAVYRAVLWICCACSPAGAARARRHRPPRAHRRRYRSSGVIEPSAQTDLDLLALGGEERAHAIVFEHAARVEGAGRRPRPPRARPIC